MNFKLLTWSIFLALITGCGVKSDPVPPAGTELPTYVDKFLEAPEPEDKEQKKERR